jgi:1-deoxy-D-xylulose-5-phosphate synthase
MLRSGKDCAILAVGVMCEPAMAAAKTLAADGLDVSVVNCRFIKPLDRQMLETLLKTHRILVTVEDGTKVNGFGAYLAAIAEEIAPEARVVIMGADDRIFEHASRPAQLAECGLNAEGIVERVRVTAAEESPVAR